MIGLLVGLALAALVVIVLVDIIVRLALVLYRAGQVVEAAADLAAEKIPKLQRREEKIP